MKVKSINLILLNRKIGKFIKDRDWNQFHSLKNLTMALAVETSELLEIFQWLTEEKSNKITKDPKTLLKVEEESADIFVYLLRILEKTDINIEKAVLKKLRKNALKYPVKLSKGNSRKYTDL